MFGCAWPVVIYKKKSKGVAEGKTKVKKKKIKVCFFNSQPKFKNQRTHVLNMRFEMH